MMRNTLRVPARKIILTLVGIALITFSTVNVIDNTKDATVEEPRDRFVVSDVVELDKDFDVDPEYEVNEVCSVSIFDNL